MKKYKTIALCFIGILLIPSLAMAQVDFNQTPNDDLGNFEDKFQEYFYEALKQKGIENYQRSIEALQKCLRFDDKQAVVHFELGKNYVQLKNFGAAEDALKKAIALDNDNEWYLDELYGIYVELNDFDKALKTVKELVEYHPDYKEDLANLYFTNSKYRAALRVLDELDNDLGVSESRDYLRNKVYNATGADDDRIEYLEQRITDNPENETAYLNLIYRYSEQGNKAKAFSTAKELISKLPNSHLAHLALYKFYLDENNASKAIESMKLIVKSDIINADAKAKVLNDFVGFVRTNPQYESDLLEVTNEVTNDDTGQSDEELAMYYLQNNNKTRALSYFQKALGKDSNNFSILKNVLLIQIELDKFNEANLLSKIGLENFPAQPILYLINGVANNNLSKPKEALKVLEIGIDYVLDDAIMESDFYKQLSVAYKLDNNITKSEAFAKKAQDVLKQND
jgi:tetratricopeptide (TPR) repeat protein